MLDILSAHARCLSFFFFFNDTATTEIYTLSLHDALPIYNGADVGRVRHAARSQGNFLIAWPPGDRKSTRLNSSHANISYAVFCLKKKKKKIDPLSRPYVNNKNTRAAYRSRLVTRECGHLL